MDRRTFVARMSMLTAAAVLMDPAEMIDRLAPPRLLVAGADFITPPRAFSRFGPLVDDEAAIKLLLADRYAPRMRRVRPRSLFDRALVGISREERQVISRILIAQQA